MDMGCIEDTEWYVTEEGDVVFTYLNPQGEARWTINKITCEHTKRYVAFDKDFMILAEGRDLQKTLASVFSFWPTIAAKKDGS